jgi:hypothetical protein
MRPPIPTTRLLALAPLLALFGACAYPTAVVTPATTEEALVDPDLRARASVAGKYEQLASTFTVPEDQAQYGAYHDYGWWPGGTWAGVSGIPPGYWVYVAPTWYIWERKAP